MEVTEKFKKEIAPFFWVGYQGGASVCLNAGEYLQDVFAVRADEGFQGSGYDWESLAEIFLQEALPDLIDKIKFDSEAGMFSAYSNDVEALQKFACRFKNACEDKPFLLDLFQRAELD